MIPSNPHKQKSAGTAPISDANIRLREYIISKHGSVNAFCKAAGIKYPAQMTPYLNGSSSLGRKMLKRLEEDGADIDWILTGKKREFSSEFAQKLMISHYRTELDNLLRKARYISDRLGEFSNVPIDAYTILDKDFRIERFSHSIEKLLGYADKKLVGRNFLELLHQNDREKIEKEILRNRKGGTVLSFLSRILNGDGRYARIEWSIFVNEVPMSENIEFAVICRKPKPDR